MEGLVVRVAWARERLPDLAKFPERARPAVYGEKGNRVGILRLGMNEVDLQVFDGGDVVWNPVHLFLDFIPVEIVGPGIVQILSPPILRP